MERCVKDINAIKEEGIIYPLSEITSTSFIQCQHLVESFDSFLGLNMSVSHIGMDTHSSGLANSVVVMATHPSY